MGGSPHPGPAPGPDDGADADADDADDGLDGLDAVLDAHDDRHADLRRYDVWRVWRGDDVRGVVPRHDVRCGARWNADRVSAPVSTTHSLIFLRCPTAYQLPFSFRSSTRRARQVEAHQAPAATKASSCS